MSDKKLTHLDTDGKSHMVDVSDLRTAMRNGASDEEIAQRFRKTVRGKLPGHGINDPKFIQPQRPMSAIGG